MGPLTRQAEVASTVPLPSRNASLTVIAEASSFLRNQYGSISAFHWSSL
jgi:hypothetical protein